MALAGFQRALAAIVMAPSLRAEVAALTPPELPAALAGFELTERERRRLHAVARDPGLKVTTVLHRATRLSMLTNTMPRTSRLLNEPGLRELVYRFWREHPPTSIVYVREATRFAQFLRGLLSSGEIIHALLGEVLEAELAILELGKAGRVAPTSRAPPGKEALEEELEQARPLLGPWCRVLPFRHEPLAVLRALDEDRTPTGLPEGEHYLVLECVGLGQVLPRGVEALRGRALMASTGERGVAALCAELGCTAELFLELAGQGLIQLHAP